MPLTPNNGMGATFLIERQRDAYLASWISRIFIYRCVGGRDDPSEGALTKSLKAYAEAKRVTKLYRGDDIPDEDCWLRGDGWCLAYR